MTGFQSTKVYDGFSTCFRQWRADGTHCRFLHGYGISFKIWFSGQLDHRNWVADFGLAKRSTHTIDGMSPDAWMKYMFDHTVVVAKDDPYLAKFQEMHVDGIIQLRVLPAVGAEKFAEYVFHKMDNFIATETQARVVVKRVEFREHEKNSAIYERDITQLRRGLVNTAT